MKHTFNELGLSESMLAAVKRLGYTEPTPVQAQAIPLATKGKDIIAAAKTGTGKTAAFTLPSMDKLGRASKKQGPLMLVITPTRELAMQISSVCEEVAKTTQHRILTVVGGQSYNPQIDKLRRGVDILVSTPGRLIDLMEQQAVKLAHVEVLVLDEADRMLDMGFWPSVKRIVAETPKSRQTMLFSATIDKAIADSADTLLKEPSYIEIAQRGETADTVEQFIIPTTHSAKPGLLVATLQEKGADKVIVFARTRSRADTCARRLRKAGFDAEAIHSDRTQSQRKRSLDNFTKGKTAVLVATDVLARGIDVADVDYVVNYDLPNQPEDYVHRIGRTGRAGESGYAISFLSQEQKSWLVDIERLIKKKIPHIQLKNYDPKAAEAEAAERATAYAKKNDPELAAAAKEHAKRQKRKSQKQQNVSSKGKEKSPKRSVNVRQEKSKGTSSRQPIQKKSGKLTPGCKSSGIRKAAG